MSDTTTLRHLEPGLDDPEVAAALAEWQAARRDLADASLALAAITAEQLDLDVVAKRGHWRAGNQADFEETRAGRGWFARDSSALEAYQAAAKRSRKALDRFHELSGLGGSR